jgi:hypothetical protein
MKQNIKLTKIDAGKDRPKTIKEQFHDIWFGALCVVAALIYTAFCYNADYFKDVADFQFQANFFGFWALAALLFGLNVGYANPNAKLFWSLTDILWISMALLSLSRILGPVEQHVMKLKAENAHSSAESDYRYVANEIAAAVKITCAQPSLAQQCRLWTDFQKEIETPDASSQNLLGRLQLGLLKIPGHPTTQEHREKIIKTQSDLKKAIDIEQKARSVTEHMDFGTPYWNIFLLTIALGLRAGKTGADIPKNLAEWRASKRGNKNGGRINLKTVRLYKADFAYAEACIKEEYINFVVQPEKHEGSVITLGGNPDATSEVNVAHSIEALADGFSSLTKAHVVSTEGTSIGSALVNLSRVRSVDVGETILVLRFIDGHTLHVAASDIQPTTELQETQHDGSASQSLRPLHS